jgi:cation diffusion facilitator family transporter
MPHFEWSDDGYFAVENRDLGGIRRVLIITMLWNFLATAIKLAAGLLTGALSVVADALDSLFDGLSNIIGLAGLHAAGMPPDADHPYGHRKFETLAALLISFLLFLTTLQLLQTAWSRLGESAAPQVSLWVVAAMLAAMLIQLGTSFYELREGRRLQSELLVADALHTRASILVSISVLAGLGLVQLGYPQADPILAALVGLVIGKIGVDILRETLPVLVDQAPIDPRRIAEVVKGVGGVESFHRVRSRGAAGSTAVDVHVRIAPDRSVLQADAIASEVRRRLLELEGVTDVTVHMEAQRSPQAPAANILALLRHAADDLGLIIHESWAHQLNGRLYVEAHVGVDPQLTLGEAHTLVDRLENELRRRAPQVGEVHTHIEMATSQVQEGEAAPAEVEKRIRNELERVVAGLPALSNPHNIIVRQRRGDRTPNYYVALECAVSPETPVSEAHELASMLESELSRRLKGVADVFVHLEPPGV